MYCMMWLHTFLLWAVRTCRVMLHVFCRKLWMILHWLAVIAFRLFIRLLLLLSWHQFINVERGGVTVWPFRDRIKKVNVPYLFHLFFFFSDCALNANVFCPGGCVSSVSAFSYSGLFIVYLQFFLLFVFFKFGFFVIMRCFIAVIMTKLH